MCHIRIIFVLYTYLFVSYKYRICVIYVSYMYHECICLYVSYMYHIRIMNVFVSFMCDICVMNVSYIIICVLYVHFCTIYVSVNFRDAKRIIEQSASSPAETWA